MVLFSMKSFADDTQRSHVPLYTLDQKIGWNNKCQKQYWKRNNIIISLSIRSRVNAFVAPFPSAVFRARVAASHHNFFSSYIVSHELRVRPLSDETLNGRDSDRVDWTVVRRTVFSSGARFKNNRLSQPFTEGVGVAATPSPRERKG